VPIVAGGTGFYLRWFVHGKPSTPASSPEAAAKALQLIGQAWVQAAADVASSQKDCQHQQHHQQQEEATSPISPTYHVQQRPAAAAAAAAAEQAALAKLPPVSPAAAQAAAQLPDAQRWDVAVDVVEQLGDPATAARIRDERNNWYRLQRVLQILVQNGGKPLSQLDVDTTKELDYDFRWVQRFRSQSAATDSQGLGC
jgi:tRNA dimethylallyltransferase